MPVVIRFPPQIVHKEVHPLRGQIPGVGSPEAPPRSRDNRHKSLEGSAHWDCIPAAPAASTTGHRGTGAAPILRPRAVARRRAVS